MVFTVIFICMSFNHIEVRSMEVAVVEPTASSLQGRALAAIKAKPSLSTTVWLVLKGGKPAREAAGSLSLLVSQRHDTPMSDASI